MSDTNTEAKTEQTIPPDNYTASLEERICQLDALVAEKDEELKNLKYNFDFTVKIKTAVQDANTELNRELGAAHREIDIIINDLNFYKRENETLLLKVGNLEGYCKRISDEEVRDFRLANPHIALQDPIQNCRMSQEMNKGMSQGTPMTDTVQSKSNNSIYGHKRR